MRSNIRKKSTMAPCMVTVLSLIFLINAGTHVVGEDEHLWVKHVQNRTTADEQMCKDNETTNTLVQEYLINNDWPALRRGLEAVLDQDSEVYHQVQDSGPCCSHLFYDMGMNGRKGLVALLLCGGLEASSADSDGDGILHGAAGGGHYRLATLLLWRGADVDARGWKSRTPLMVAAAAGSWEAAEVLQRAGANITARDQDGRTALDWAQLQQHPQIAQWLAQVSSVTDRRL